MIQRSVAFLVLALVFVTGASAQQQAPRSAFKIAVDLARFRGPDDTTASIEVYYAIAQDGLTYKPDSTGLSAGADITVLAMKHDSVVYADRWLVPSSVRDTSSLVKGMNLVGLYRIQLHGGEYVLKLIGRDQWQPNRRDSVMVKFPIRPVTTEKTVLSDVELASSIHPSDRQSPFFKNTLEVIPNVGGVYSGEQTCYYYVEAYNLLAKNDNSNYVVRTAVYDAVGREQMAKERPRKRPAESSVLVDQLGMSGLHSGTYTLAVSLLDSSKKTMTASSRKFFVMNNALGVDSSLAEGNTSLPLAVLASMDEEQLDEEFREARYEATDVEREQYAKLKGADAKRQFLSSFWRKRPVGFRDEYMQRVSFVNMNYPTMGRKGYRTDRGRVFIMYGAPDDYERHPSESDSRPYEIWQYNNIQGGVIFVFVQRNTTGDYELVHSTHRNELHDDDWQRYLSPQ